VPIEARSFFLLVPGALILRVFLPLLIPLQASFLPPSCLEGLQFERALPLFPASIFSSRRRPEFPSIFPFVLAGQDSGHFRRDHRVFLD